MADLPIKDIGGQINAIDGAQKKMLNTETGGNFESVINEALSKVSQVQEDVDKAVNELASGGDITSAVLAIEKADMTFQLMTEVRNKLLRTYEEVMKMQV